MQFKQIDHLPEVCKSSSLFVDPSSRAFRSWAVKPCKACGNNTTIHEYLKMNWSKLTIKEEISKYYQHNNIYGKCLYYCNKGKYIEKECYILNLNVATFPSNNANQASNENMNATHERFLVDYIMKGSQCIIFISCSLFI